MKKTKRWMAVLMILAAAGGVFRWAPWKKDRPEFREVRVERADLRIVIPATGVVQPQNRVEIKSPIAGRVEEVLAREGGRARKGDTLAWMSSVERAALLDAARAKGPEELAHWTELYKPTPLIAPLSGSVIARKVEPGQTVTAQDPVLVMSDRLIVKAQVDETDIARIRVGQEAEIVLDAYPRDPIAARADHIAYEAQTVNNVTVYQVDVVAEKVPDSMRSGMTANVSFLVERKEGVLTLPVDAVRSRDGRSEVLTGPPSGENRRTAKSVETGLSDGRRVEIVSGLSEGETVLLRVVNLPAGKSQDSPFSPWSRPRRSPPEGGAKAGR